MKASIRVAVADAELRDYVLECVSAMRDLTLAGGSDGADLIVTDGESSGGGRQLRIVDDLPHDGGEYLLMPFDGLALMRAIRRALNR
jgi:hypothetical protein